MPVTHESAATGQVESAGLYAALGPLGNELADAYRRLLAAIPGAPHTPTALARQLGLSRVIVSKLVNALARSDPYEILDQVPGPESLRAITRAAAEFGLARDLIAPADRAVDAFATRIRDDFGTRSALSAAVTTQSPQSRFRFERASRYQVFLGLRQILGVEAKTWLTSMMFVPAPDDPARLAVTTIHGALAMRRLRPDVNVYFTFGPPPQATPEQHDVSRPPIELREFYTHPPAPLESQLIGGQLVHRLAHNRLGRRAAVDMLAVGHDARGSQRYATPQRPRGGVVVFPDVPVKTLICDALLDDDVFPGATPELVVYDPGSRGPANPADRARDIDRVVIPERIEALDKAESRFDVPEVPHYRAMVTRVCAQVRVDMARLRVFRLRMQYPVHNFQIVMAFDAPPQPV